MADDLTNKSVEVLEEHRNSFVDFLSLLTWGALLVAAIHHYMIHKYVEGTLMGIVALIGLWSVISADRGFKIDESGVLIERQNGDNLSVSWDQITAVTQPENTVFLVVTFTASGSEKEDQFSIYDPGLIKVITEKYEQRKLIKNRRAKLTKESETGISEQS